MFDVRLDNRACVDLCLHDVTGRVIGWPAQQLVLGPGQHQIAWESSHQPSQVVFYRLSAGDETAVGKIALVTW